MIDQNGSCSVDTELATRPTKGMEVVKAIEAVGSQSGKTAKPVVIADAGQIA